MGAQISVTGDFSGGLIISAGLPRYFRPRQVRVVLTAEQSEKLWQLLSILRSREPVGIVAPRQGS